MKKGVFFLMLSLLLSGCAQHELEVLTVEFQSGAVVENVQVALIDGETERIIETKQTDDEGRVSFSALKNNHPYIVSNVSFNESSLADSTKFTYTKDMTYFLFETHYAHNTQGLDVPVMVAPESMQSGSALVSLAAVFKYYGVPITIQEIYDTMPRADFILEDTVLTGPHPNKIFAGDAYDNNGYVLSQPVAETAQILNERYDAPLSVYNASKKPNDELLAIIESGVPVIAWVTKDMQLPTKGEAWTIFNEQQQFSSYANMHAVVITGKSASKIQVIDSREGKKTYDLKTFLNVFQASGAQAVVIRK